MTHQWNTTSWGLTLFIGHRLIADYWYHTNSLVVYASALGLGNSKPFEKVCSFVDAEAFIEELGGWLPE